MCGVDGCAAVDAVSLAEQAGGLLTGSKVSRNSLGNVLTGAASAARRTVGEQTGNDALRTLYNAAHSAGRSLHSTEREHKAKVFPPASGGRI